MPPLKLKEIRELKERDIPEYVYDAINLLIAQRIGNSRIAKFTISQAVSKILDIAPEGTTRDEIQQNYWLDFESAYRKIGWDVDYDNPAYNETYEGNWTFTWKGE